MADLFLLGQSYFPQVDPIPLPAPVWLMKFLHELTLVLHFLALYMLLGGLLLTLILNAIGHYRRDLSRVEASSALAGWLPTITTYVINLGIPPLLFAQVLYGRALYTSSVLIGASWIAVIPLLIFAYHLLYLMKARASEGRAFYGLAFFSLVTMWGIARIYSMNMALTNDPPAWQAAYAENTHGTKLFADVTAWYRWGYMLLAGACGGGILALWVARSGKLSTSAKAILTSTGWKTILVSTAAALCVGFIAWNAQNDAVKEVCNSGNTYWLVTTTVWALGAVGAAALSLAVAKKKQPNSWVLPTGISLAAFLQTSGFVLCRSQVRDAALGQYGFNVWDRTVVSNISVLVVFFLLFVVGLAVVGWLAWVGYQSKKEAVV